LQQDYQLLEMRLQRRSSSRALFPDSPFDITQYYRQNIKIVIELAVKNGLLVSNDVAKRGKWGHTPWGAGLEGASTQFRLNYV